MLCCPCRSPRRGRGRPVWAGPGRAPPAGARTTHGRSNACSWRRPVRISSERHHPRRQSIVRVVAKAIAKWSGQKVRFDIEAASGHSAATDEPPIFGDDTAMHPTEMLLGALGGCTGLNAVLLLKKFKQPVKSLEVEVEGEQDK